MNRNMFMAHNASKYEICDCIKDPLFHWFKLEVLWKSHITLQEIKKLISTTTSYASELVVTWDLEIIL